MDPNRPNFSKLTNPAFIEYFDKPSFKDAEIFDNTYISFHDKGVTTLDDIELFPKLKSLEIGKTRIEDLSSLAECPRLEELGVAGSPIRSFEPLRRIPQIKKVYVSGDQFPTLQAAGELPHVRQVQANDDLQSIRYLPDMPNLRILHFRNGKIGDLDSIERFPHLVNLMGDGSTIKTVEPLAHCPKLTHIKLTLDESVNLDPLSSLKELRVLWLSGDKPDQFTCLLNLPKLRTISCFPKGSYCFSDGSLLNDGIKYAISSWDPDFASDSPLFTPSIKLKWVTEEEFRYFDTKHPFNVEDYDWNSMMLEDECYWVAHNIQSNLCAKYTVEKHYKFWNLGRIRRSIPVTIGPTDDYLDIDWMINQIQQGLCRANKTWILFMADTACEEMWIYPDHVEMVGKPG